MYSVVLILYFYPSVSGGYGVATGGPYAWGLCYNKELSPSQSYCDESFKYTFPCAPGADYYGRGAIPIYWYAFFELFAYLFIMLVAFSFDRFVERWIVCVHVHSCLMQLWHK